MKSDFKYTFMVYSSISKFFILSVIPMLIQFWMKPDEDEFLKFSAVNAIITLSVYCISILVFELFDFRKILKMIWLFLLKYKLFFRFRLNYD
jgi:hypothetical protein